MPRVCSNVTVCVCLQVVIFMPNSSEYIGNSKSINQKCVLSRLVGDCWYARQVFEIQQP